MAQRQTRVTELLARLCSRLRDGSSRDQALSKSSISAAGAQDIASVVTAEARQSHHRAASSSSEVSHSQSVATQTATAFRSLSRNDTLSFAIRIALYAFGVVALFFALLWTVQRDDDIVGQLLNDQADFREDRLLAVAIPMILLVLLALAAFAMAMFISSRAARDFQSGVEGVSRLRREAAVGVLRTRSMTHVFEEFLDQGRRAFRLQLWLSQTMFVVALLFFGAATVQALASEVDLLTAGLGAGSLIAVVVAWVAGAAGKIGNLLSNATQVQIVVTNATRQVNVIEELAYKLIENNKEDPAPIRDAVNAEAREIATITDSAVALIQGYTEEQQDAGSEAEPSEPEPEGPPEAKVVPHARATAETADGKLERPASPPVGGQEG